MIKSKPTRPTIRSKQPCPVCGGREWYPMYVPYTRRGERTGPVAFDEVGSTIPMAAVIDASYGDNDVIDECTACHTVVC